MANTVIETRRDQIFPLLADEEVQRLRRFGEVRTYEAGAYLFRAGEVSPGMFVMLAGAVRITRRDAHGHEEIIVEQGPGQFLAELAQLSGKPSLVDGLALSAVEVLVIPPERLRALLIAEAELGEKVMRALILRRVALIEEGAGPIIVGHAGQGDVLRLQGFLNRNGHPHYTLDPDQDEEARQLLQRFHVAPDELPIVLCPGGQLLRNPSERELARCMGLVGALDPDKVYDVAVVGAGPAGMATAVYAASEGLSVLVLDCRAFGGQAGASARIENYLGFPTGVSGMALMARAYNQAQKFGADIAIPEEVVTVETAPDAAHGRFRLTLAGDERANARAVVIASGALYRQLEVENLAEFEGSCVHYWASPLERKLCGGQEVALVGAGNSAGQAVVYLAAQVAKVWMIVRGPSLEASMSKYLIDRIKGLPNVEVVVESEVTALEGEPGALSAVRWRNRKTGEETRRALRHLFLFIGADPNTAWMAQCAVVLDGKGFVLTGADLDPPRGVLETSRDGVFAIGDVRSGSTKRVAAAVGEGAQVVAALHAHLAAQDPANA
jgi:thioredoxin reductase (NADPH)